MKKYKTLLTTSALALALILTLGACSKKPPAEKEKAFKVDPNVQEVTKPDTTDKPTINEDDNATNAEVEIDPNTNNAETPAPNVDDNTKPDEDAANVDAPENENHEIVESESLTYILEQNNTHKPVTEENVDEKDEDPTTDAKKIEGIITEKVKALMMDAKKVNIFAEAQVVDETDVPETFGPGEEKPEGFVAEAPVNEGKVELWRKDFIAKHLYADNENTEGIIAISKLPTIKVEFDKLLMVKTVDSANITPGKIIYWELPMVKENGFDMGVINGRYYDFFDKIDILDYTRSSELEELMGEYYEDKEEQ